MVGPSMSNKVLFLKCAVLARQEADFSGRLSGLNDQRLSRTEERSHRKDKA